ncbi:hypothetical protein PSPTOT1_0268 [Pseudomonas syringae pv. tomato T1]|nr:hypothetical protein PSPTOT1_0268 [Pseudomonas syringae pv. tomato T1]
MNITLYMSSGGGFYLSLFNRLRMKPYSNEWVWMSVKLMKQRASVRKCSNTDATLYPETPTPGFIPCWRG